MITEVSVTDYRSVALTEADTPEVLELDSLAFADPDGERPPLPLAWDRTRGVRSDDGELAAVRSSYAFDLPVPGGAVPAAGLSWVGVHPAHRRRGLAAGMIAEHLRHCVRRGEPVSVLTASEAAIYGRFGYGSASPAVTVTVPRGAALREVPAADRLRVHLERADLARHEDLVQRVHRAAGDAGPGRPGWVSRPTAPLRAMVFFDPPSQREGAEALRLLTVIDPDGAGGAGGAGGAVRGYALFARTERPRGPLSAPGTRVVVREAVAVDAAAARALWGLLLDLDLTAVVEARLAPDDALLQLLVDVRSAAPVVRDHVWVRLVDVPAALAARRYPAPVDVVLEVTDTLVPANAGRWHLVGGPDGAQVRATTAPAHLALDVRDLGAAYLGGVPLGAMAGAGLVRELVPGALVPASTAFGWPLAPVCSWGF